MWHSSSVLASHMEGLGLISNMTWLAFLFRPMTMFARSTQRNLAYMSIFKPGFIRCTNCHCHSLLMVNVADALC